jgi:hypothetical protein
MARRCDIFALTRNFHGRYDGANIVQEKAGSTVNANVLTGGVDDMFTRSDSSGTASLITDTLGSTMALTDSAGAIQTEHSYEPFGKTRAHALLKGSER